MKQRNWRLSYGAFCALLLTGMALVVGGSGTSGGGTGTGATNSIIYMNMHGHVDSTPEVTGNIACQALQNGRVVVQAGQGFRVPGGDYNIACTLAPVSPGTYTFVISEGVVPCSISLTIQAGVNKTINCTEGSTAPTSVF